MTAPQRLLLVIGSGQLGGGSTQMLRHLRALDRARWSPTLVCDADGPLADEARQLGVEVRTLTFMRRRIGLGPIRSLRRWLRQEDFSIVHAFGTRAALVVALARGRRVTPGFIYAEHGLASAVPRGAATSWLAGRAEAYVAARADRIIALTGFARREIERLAPQASAKVVVIPNAIEPARDPLSRAAAREALGAPGEGPLIGMIARLAAVKGPGDFVATAVRVHRMEPSARFCLVGDGPLRQALAKQIEDSGAPIRLKGTLPEAARYLRGFDVLCLTSRSEGMPLVILEAMLAGVPVVATDVGGVSSVIDDERTGLLVPPANPERFAAVVCDILRSPDRARALAERARAEVLDHHELGAITEQIVAQYASVLAGEAANA